MSGRQGEGVIFLLLPLTPTPTRHYAGALPVAACRRDRARFKA